MLSEMGVRSMVGGGGDGFNGEDIGLLLREQRRQQQEASDRERELNIYRSGSAPPTVEGSLTAMGGVVDLAVAKNGNGFRTEEELRSDPAYSSYYFSHVNLNPRLPPPVLSKEDWRSMQRLQAGSSAVGGIGDRRKVGEVEEGSGGSLFGQQPGFGFKEEQGSGEWLGRGGDGLIGLSLGRQKSFADIFQDDLGDTTSVAVCPSRATTCNAFDGGIEPLSSAETHPGLHHDKASVDGLRSGRKIQTVGGLQNMTSHSFASVLGSSLQRSATPDPQLLARARSPCLPPVGLRLGSSDKKLNGGSCSFNGVSSNVAESDDLLTVLSGMNLSDDGSIDSDSIAQAKLQQEIGDHQNYLFNLQGGQNHDKQYPSLNHSEAGQLSMPSIPQTRKSSYHDFSKRNAGLAESSNSMLVPDAQAELHRPTAPATNPYMKAASAPSVTSPGTSPGRYQNFDSTPFTSYGLNGYSINPALQSLMANQIGTGNLPPLFENAATASAIAALGMDYRSLGGSFSSGSNLNGVTDLQTLNRIGNSPAAAQMPLVDPLYIQYLKAAEYAAQAPANFTDPSIERGYTGNSYLDLLEIQKAYLAGLFQQQKQYNTAFLGKSGASDHGYYGNPAYGLNLSYPGSPLATPIPASPVGPGSPLRQAERNLRFPSGLSNFAGGAMGSWHPDPSGNMDAGFPTTLLEEFKSSKTRCFELSEIARHVVEFSADQYGSRFIQQKLETATIEEKNMVFEEIMPHALSLMTDVFGNYVIQKFFEHGTAAQIRELANQLNGHVLALSLQMYGCRVIQKAIEVVSLDQQTKMVQELDGHVMRCVRDQNGNHVIQKCIECIPQEAIQFIISSFYEQVVNLSTHPYGCRVIQRVLEHCDDPHTQQIVMDEILNCVCMLAQDQYGNYVIQHVLEHGKPHERSAIIKQLAGQIVQMSQQKFASNVVEKCLTFGGPVERQILVNEMLGSTDENEPLQAMMKDQFANYVVQKVLETCEDQQRELILSRIKVHLNALKKYTYGKHIVARVEKLVAAGERRIGLQSQYPS